MLINFSELLEKACQGRCYRVCVASATDADLLAALKMAEDRGFVRPLLTGPPDILADMARQAGLRQYDILPADGPEACAAEAVRAVRKGRAEVLMKGSINTTCYMQGILNKEWGLRGGGILSALAAYEVKEYHKLIFCTDSGINTAPDLAQKKAILDNALEALARLGFVRPKVAALAASEVVHPKIPATVDAAELARLSAAGELPCLLEGPIALDVAFDPQAAAHKGIVSRISGEVDLLLSPNIETGNALGKSWLTLNKAKWAGVVLGATHPVVLGSRSDSAEVKINSIALACLLATQETQHA